MADIFATQHNDPYFVVFYQKRITKHYDNDGYLRDVENYAHLLTIHQDELDDLIPEDKFKELIGALQKYKFVKVRFDIFFE